MSTNSLGRPGFNLLTLRPVRALALWPGFPYAFQICTLAIFVELAALGSGHLTPEGVNAKLYAKTNLVNLAIWGLWWPAIVWVTVLFGRFTSWAGFLPGAWAKPTGVQTALKMNAKLMPQPAAWLSGPTLSFIAMLVIGITTLLAIREHVWPTRTNTGGASLPFCCVGLVLLPSCVRMGRMDVVEAQIRASYRQEMASNR